MGSFVFRDNRFIRAFNNFIYLVYVIYDPSLGFRKRRNNGHAI